MKWKFLLALLLCVISVECYRLSPRNFFRRPSDPRKNLSTIELSLRYANASSVNKTSVSSTKNSIQSVVKKSVSPTSYVLYEGDILLPNNTPRLINQKLKKNSLRKLRLKKRSKHLRKLKNRRKLNKKKFNKLMKPSMKRNGILSKRINRDKKLKSIRNVNKNRVRRAATAKKELIWDYGVIPYEIDGNFTGIHKTLFKQAMRHWENYTCIKFVERHPPVHPNYIVFTELACGCCSFMGKRGNGAQAISISIGKHCDKFGTVVHELGHAMGFWHEHTRPDRDEHINIVWNNIIRGQETNFNISSLNDVDALGLPYDFDSIMHYAKDTFSKGPFLDTIIPKTLPNGMRPKIGQRSKLSNGDIQQAKIVYKCKKCGRTLQNSFDSFSSPVGHTDSCEWRIQATYGERIILNITELDIAYSMDCSTDYLEIRDGYWHLSPIIGRYCGSTKPPELISSNSSRMLINYVTTESQSGHRGFSAYYQVICGGDLNMDEGRLESPNYPLNYVPNKDCVWRITVPSEYQVAVKFHSFDIENQGNQDNCSYDFIEFRDGDSQNASIIGIYCGNKIPADLTSTTNKLYVRFKSDSTVQRAGFSASFIKELNECEKLNHGCSHRCINLLGSYRCACNVGYELDTDMKSCKLSSCGGVLFNLNGTISSPSYPMEYPASKYCIWEIVAPPQYRIILKFNEFNLEGNVLNLQDCDYDAVNVYSIMNSTAINRHGRFCGNRLPPLITSITNSLRVTFRSDRTIEKDGFIATYSTDFNECTVKNGGCQHKCKNLIGSYKCSCFNGYTLSKNKHDCVPGGCKHEITAMKGKIISPNYPEKYSPNSDCVWYIRAAPGHRIRLTFDAFQVECEYDIVNVHDGKSPLSFTLGNFCGNELPFEVTSSRNEMYIAFKSDGNVQMNGFSAVHTTECGGRLVAKNRPKRIVSHASFGKENYESSTICDWFIFADSNRNIELTFNEFELEEDKECMYDFVEVWDGSLEFSGELLGRFCGSKIPPHIISNSDTLRIRFLTDDTSNTKGFSLTYAAIDLPETDVANDYYDIIDDHTPFPGSLKSVVINSMDEDGYLFD